MKKLALVSMLLLSLNAFAKNPEVVIKTSKGDIEVELFEDKDTQIVVRCKESFKNEVKSLAKDNQLKLSSYIKYLLTQELKKSKKYKTFCKTSNDMVQKR